MPTAPLPEVTLPARRRPVERLRVGPPSSPPKVPVYYDHQQGTLVRQGSGLPVTWEEWNNLDRHQRQEALRLVPAAKRASIDAAITMRARARAWVGEGLEPEARDRSFRLRLRHAARLARKTLGGSHATAATLAELAGGIDPQQAPRDTRAKGLTIARLGEAIRRGLLRPGMVVHASQNPRAIAAGESAQPVWLTYLGPDRQHGPRFADTQNDAWTIEALARAYESHQIDWIADPYAPVSAG
ncbi:MAG: hypothetical protein VKP62_15360 [Candidatus Sericytochromatia bacterium]|nr:hypothetical protein [Candidatus Sericytochromatia bacterium]